MKLLNSIHSSTTRPFNRRAEVRLRYRREAEADAGGPRGHRGGAGGEARAPSKDTNE